MEAPSPESSAGPKEDEESAVARRRALAVSEGSSTRPALTHAAVPDHELLRCIGRGAYGAVWLARNVMGTHRAVKILQREDFDRDRPFHREYEGLLKYEPISRSHPNLMQILQVGRRSDCFYYVTELADDIHAASTARAFDPAAYIPRTLADDLERCGYLSVRECVMLATALGAALKHLHHHGLVHRDVKPSNVIFVHGVAKLADIGLVATFGDSRSIVGTEGYLPPEGPGTPQADLFALGKLLYEASTGMRREAFPRLPEDLRQRPDAAELLELNEVLLRACARDTERRYHHADELLADLALLERGASVKRLRRLERYHATIKRAAVGVLAVGALLFGAWWQSWQTGRVARGHLATLHLHEGTRRMVQGDYANALPWLVGALELDAGDPPRQEAHRARLVNVLNRCPSPMAGFFTPDSKILTADLNADGTRLATGHEDGVVRLWDTATGDCLRRFRHGYPVVLCQFVSSAAKLVTATIGQEARVWDLADPDGETVTFGQAVGIASEGYAVGMNESLQRAYLSKGAYRFARIHPGFHGPFENLTLLLKLAGSRDDLRVEYQIRRGSARGDVLYEGELIDSSGMDAFADGRDDPPAPAWGDVFIGLENASVGDKPGESGEQVWESVRVRRYPTGSAPTPWRILDDFSGHTPTNWIHVVGANSGSSCQTLDGRLHLYSRNLPLSHLRGQCAVRIELFEVGPGHTFEVEADLVSTSAPHRHAALAVYRPDLTAFAPARVPLVFHNRWLVLSKWEGTSQIFDLRDRRFVKVGTEAASSALALPRGGQPHDLDVSPDLQHFAHVTLSGSGSICRLGNAEEITPTPLAGMNVKGVRFTPDNRFLIVSHAVGVHVLETSGWKSVRALAAHGAFDRLCLSSTGERVAAVRDDTEVMVWDLADPTEEPATFAHDFLVERMAFSPDSRYLACSTADGMLRVWDVIERTQLGPPLPGSLAGFSADGTLLMCFDNEHAVWLWDLARVTDDTLVVPTWRHGQRSASSADQTWTAEIVGTVIHLATREVQFVVPSPHGSPLARLGFSADNVHLIAEDLDHRAWVWDLRTLSLVGPPRPLRYDTAVTNYSLPSIASDGLEQAVPSELSALLSGQRPDGQGGMEEMDRIDRTRRLLSLKRTHPERFRSGPANRWRWHRQHAVAAEISMDWTAAVTHWEHAVGLDRRTDGQGGAMPSLQSEAGRPSWIVTPDDESRLIYARRAAEAMRPGLAEGRSRWSIVLPRPRWATAAMLDLDPYYTGGYAGPLLADRSTASFRKLAGGVQVLAGVGFDLRGIVRVEQGAPIVIPVSRPCRRIHFLHAAGPATGSQGIRRLVGQYQATFVGGEKAAVQLMTPEDVPPYTESGFHAVSLTEWHGTSPELTCALAWSGCNSERTSKRELLFLTRTTWELPQDRLDTEVTSLELRAWVPERPLLLFAITVE